MTVLEGKNLTFSYKPDQPPLFTDVSLAIQEGECVALCGASGCGKSTLCYILSGIIPRNMGGRLSGEVLLLGDSAAQLDLYDVVQRVGVVFQNPDSQLFSPTVEDEIAFGPENLCLPREEIKKRVDNVLDTVGMQAFRLSSPDKLSGGQKQLIALAAVLALEPKVLIFDEALSQLDDEATARIKDIIAALKKDGKAILMVEHDPDNFDIADRIYKMENGGLLEVSNV